mgnify:CR=1 FL=1
MNTFWAFGDSFILGDQDDFGPGDCNYSAEHWQDHGMSYDQRIEWCRGVSFARALAGSLEYRNLAERGAGNFTSLDLVYAAPIQSGDTVLFGISSTTRDRIRMLGYREARGLVHPRIDPELAAQYDQLTILGALEEFSLEEISLNDNFSPNNYYNNILNYTIGSRSEEHTSELQSH